MNPVHYFELMRYESYENQQNSLKLHQHYFVEISIAYYSLIHVI
jgi:hypothetical protein